MKRITLSIVVAIITFALALSATSIWNVESNPPPNAPPTNPPPNGQDTGGKAALEMVFVLDTTGSMGGLIEGAKQRIWSIVNDVMQASSRPAVRVGLVAYRDRGDDYVTKVLPLTNDLDQVYSTLMDYQAAGGGDGPENVRRALADAVHQSKWSKDNGVARIIFLVGDAPPHDDYADEPSTMKTAAEAVRLGMTINTIQCGSVEGTQQAWQLIAQRAEGKYFSIAQDGGVQAITTPYDRSLSELGSKIGASFVAYGGGAGAAGAASRAHSAEAQAKLEHKIAASAPPQASADRAKNKAINKDAYAGDLLQAIENGSVKLDSIKEEDLPDDLQKLSAEARKQEIEKRIAERKKLRNEILTLSKQRDEFIAAERKKSAAGKQGSFDVAVGAALREQLERKGIKW